MTRLVLPPRLRAGDRVAALAPSSPFPQDTFDAGCARLRAFGLEPVPLVHAAADPLVYLAGGDRERADALEATLRSREFRGVYCARGGYGVLRLLDRVPWGLLRGDPRPVIGFSDVTALHVAGICHARVGAVHAPLLTTLATSTPEASEATRQLLLDGEPPVLRAAEDAPRRAGHNGWTVVDGPLLVANLATLASMVGSADLPPLDGWIVLLEDWHERAYRIDRMLTQLLRAGALGGVVGVALGDFSGDRLADGSGPCAADVFLERLGTLGIPFAAGFPVGHVAANWPAIVGARYQLDVDAGELRPLERLPAP